MGDFVSDKQGHLILSEVVQMILTVTLNPAVDMSYKLATLNLDTVNRVTDISKTAGGKGLNVARVAKQLGAKVSATGFLGGNLGDFISQQITEQGIEDQFARISGNTRNCIAVIHEGQQTEILESGPTITAEEMAAFLISFTDYARDKEIIALSGSLPKGLPTDFYAQLIEIANELNVPVILDTSGETLFNAVKGEYKPFMIKPNEEELAGLLGKQELEEKEIIESLHSVLFTDIPLVVVTRGAAGAIVKYHDVIYRVSAPEIKAVNAVGSGDSVVAGFATGLTQNLADDELIKYGLAMGTLNALEEKTGQIDPSKVTWAIENMTITTL